MKKVLSYILTAGIALAGIFSCTQEPLATFDPAKATAPVVQNAEVTEDGLTVTFTPAVANMGFNEKIQLNHWLILSKMGSEEVNENLNTKVDGNTISISTANLSKALIALGKAEGDNVNLEMILRASLQDPARDNRVNGYIDAEKKINIPWEVRIPQSGGGPKIPDIDLSQYEDLEIMAGAETWGIIGPAVSDWSVDVDLKKISDNPEVWYAGNIPFAADKFKFRGNDTWGDYDLGGGEFAINAPIVMSKGGGDMTAEAGSYDVYLFPVKGVAYITTGGGGSSLPDIDLSQYDYLDIMEGADTWGIIGPAVSDWSVDVDLEKVSDDPEIWCAKDVPFQEDKFKFRGNDTWADYDLGGGEFALNTPIVMTKGGGDMTATAGSYTVYLYPTYGVAYITDGGGQAPPPPAKPSVWSLIGTINGTNWDTDFDLTKGSGDVWKIRNVAITATDKFKIRADHDWAKSVGGPEANGDGVYTPVIGTAFAAGEVDILIGVEGAYDITFDYAAQTILIEEYQEFADYIYAIGGDLGWSSCYPLSHVFQDGNPTGSYKGFGYLSQEFKFKPHENDWDGDWEFAEAGKIADIKDGPNCPAPDPSYYMIEVNLKEMTYTLTPITTIGVVGPAQAGGWDADTDLTFNVQTGAWEGTLDLSAGEMKFRANDDWAINWGGTLDALTQGGANITVAAGTYDIQLFAWCDGKAYATLNGGGGASKLNITIDGNTSDWVENANVVSMACANGAALTGMKSAKVYYSDKLYMLFEFSDEALAKGVQDGKLRLHVFFNSDNNTEGGLLRFWDTPDIDYMLEGKATSGGSYTDFSSKLYKWSGAEPGDWSWDGDGAIKPTMVSAGSGNFFEVSMDYSDFTGGLADVFSIGFDCADGDYNVMGYLPNVAEGTCPKATVSKVK